MNEECFVREFCGSGVSINRVLHSAHCDGESGGEKIGERFKGFAYDDYPIQKADQHEEDLKQHQIDYVRIEL